MSKLTKTEIAWHMQSHLDSMIKLDKNYTSDRWAEYIKKLSDDYRYFLINESKPRIS